ncbi:MAG TPA: YdeI/OmpD-associated family protein [Chloroflexia bacterium]|nr:YdeI/OmpD-associated family protein [Chloroflexia bacterium]
MEVVFFESQSELRKWLEANHDKAKELWVGFYKKSSGQAGITYAEALDEALCFGWIDGIRKSVDEISYTNRFTPRKPGSKWSMVNIKRANELVEAGLMQPSGLKAFSERDEKKSKLYSYEERARKLDDAYEEQFRANKEAWDFFQAQPPGYQRSAAWWIMSAKREETRLKRLAALIAGSRKGERLVEVTG